MKQLLENPIMVNLEIGLIHDVIRIIGQSINKSFSHDEIEAVKQQLITKSQLALQQHKSAIPESSQEKI
jgi:hypothetical protein